MPNRGDDLELISAQAGIENLGEEVEVFSTLGYSTAFGIFSAPFLSVNISDVPIASADTTFILERDSCPTLEVGATLTRRNLEYRVDEIQDDGVIQTLQLHVI